MDPLYFYIPNQSGMGTNTREGEGKGEREKEEKRKESQREERKTREGKGKEVSIVLLYFSPLFPWPKGLYSRRRSGRGSAREMSGRNSIGENCSDSSHLFPQSLFHSCILQFEAKICHIFQNSLLRVKWWLRMIKERRKRRIRLIQLISDIIKWKTP